MIFINFQAQPSLAETVMKSLEMITGWTAEKGSLLRVSINGESSPSCCVMCEGEAPAPAYFRCKDCRGE